MKEYWGTAHSAADNMVYRTGEPLAAGTGHRSHFLSLIGGFGVWQVAAAG
ncbi:hypothetical protein MM300_05410 [Evansella sp. LMS18]|nr:hypothetical protein [Evansella sp. LMS18]UTR13105.1 hypothetical protein MM300_05410 [Evansella sp. LMS18]